MSALSRYAFPALFLICCIAFLAQPLWHFSLQGATDDWRWFHFHWEVSRTSILEFGQLPAWNPFHCGGHVHLANPQTQFLSPLFLPALLFGVPVGLKLFLLLHFIAGYASTWWLAGEHGLRGFSRAVPAMVFCCSGFFAFHTGGGHSAFLPFLYLPAVLASFRRGIRDPRFLGGTASLLALMALEGGVYPLPYSALMLSCYALFLAIQGPDRSTPLLRLATAGSAAALLAGIKLVPVLSFLRERSRITPSDDSISLFEIFEMFLSRRLERAYPGHVYVWPEYASYVGPLVVASVLGLLLWSRLRRHRIWWALLVVFSLLIMGNQGPWSPHELLHRLPVFGSLRVPSRFAVIVTLCLAMLAGFATQEISQWLLKGQPRPILHWRRWLPVLLWLLAIADLILFAQHQFGRFRDQPRTGGASAEVAFQMTRDPWHHGPWLPRYRRGTLACYEPNPVPRGRVRAGRASEVFLAGGARGQARITRWSPNQVSFEASLTRPGVVVLNQNEHRGWQVVGAGERVSHGGMPAVRLAQGASTASFEYRVPGLRVGLGASLLGVFFLAWLLLGNRRRPRPAGKDPESQSPAVAPKEGKWEGPMP